jgi:hypothetical protein
MSFAAARVVATSLVSGSVLLAVSAPGALAAEASTSVDGTAALCEQMIASTPSPSPSATSPSPSASASPSASPTPSPSASPTPSPDVSSPATPTPSPSDSDSAAAKSTPQAATPTPAATTATPKPSATTSATPTATSAAKSSKAALAALVTVATPASSAPSPELCMGITGTSASVKAGQSATFDLQVSTENWTPPIGAAVTIVLSAQPAGQGPVFTASSNCLTPAQPAATCVVSAPGTTPAQLQAQVPLNATASISSITLDATVTISAMPLSPPLSVSQTMQVTAATAPQSTTSTHTGTGSHSDTTSSAPGDPGDPGGTIATVPLGDIPSLTGPGSSSSLIGAGNATGLFPAISPSATPAPSVQPLPRASKKDTAAAPTASVLPFGTPVATAQVIGLIALAVAALLSLTRLSASGVWNRLRHRD